MRRLPLSHLRTKTSVTVVIQSTLSICHLGAVTFDPLSSNFPHLPFSPGVAESAGRRAEKSHLLTKRRVRGTHHGP